MLAAMQYVIADQENALRDGTIKLHGPDAFAGMRRAGALAAAALEAASPWVILVLFIRGSSLFGWMLGTGWSTVSWPLRHGFALVGADITQTRFDAGSIAL